jgi:hypothetical protein
VTLRWRIKTPITWSHTRNRMQTPKIKLVWAVVEIIAIFNWSHLKGIYFGSWNRHIHQATTYTDRILKMYLIEYYQIASKRLDAWPTYVRTYKTSAMSFLVFSGSKEYRYGLIIWQISVTQHTKFNLKNQYTSTWAPQRECLCLSRFCYRQSNRVSWLKPVAFQTTFTP